jgi:hypothetical protein
MLALRHLTFMGQQIDVHSTLLPTSTTHIHHECRVRKNVLPSLYNHFSVSWIFIFSITLFCGHPPQCAYLRLQTELKMPSHASRCQWQELAATASTELAKSRQKCHFLFYNHFSVGWFFSILCCLNCVTYNKFCFTQFEQQDRLLPLLGGGRHILSSSFVEVLPYHVCMNVRVYDFVLTDLIKK